MTLPTTTIVQALTFTYLKMELDTRHDSKLLRLRCVIAFVASSVLALTEGLLRIVIQKPFNFIARTVCDLTGKDRTPFIDSAFITLIQDIFKHIHRLIYLFTSFICI